MSSFGLACLLLRTRDAFFPFYQKTLNSDDAMLAPSCFDASW